MAKLELLYRIKIHDREGRLTRDTGLKPSGSLVFQFMQILAALMRNADVPGGKDTDGSAMTIDASALVVGWAIYAYGGATYDYVGILIGTGTTAPTNVDYAMEAAIAHGLSTGEMEYGAQSYTNPTVVGANVDFIITRTFTNSSGASISVTEIGLFAATKKVTNISAYPCIARDVLTEAEVVTDGAAITVQYTVRTSV